MTKAAKNYAEIEEAVLELSCDDRSELASRILESLEEVDGFAVNDVCQNELKALHDLLAECGKDDWDGYGAKSPTSVVGERAAMFIKKLPNDLARPDLIAMPNGDVGFDWDFAPRRTITVTIAESPRLAYAAIDGDEQWRGTVSFTGEIPQRMIRAIHELAAKG